MHSIDNDTFTGEQGDKLNEHIREEKRRKRQLKKQGKEIRNTRKRVKLNKTFEYLNEILKKVKVEESEQTTRNRQILVFDLTLKGQDTFTPSEYL